MNRVQFQASLSTPVFLLRYGTWCACEKALLEARWHEGFKCICCSGQRAGRFQRGQQAYWQCSLYHRQTNLHSGTVFDNSKLPLTIWFLALYLLTKGKINLAALELMRHPGVFYCAVWRLKHKLMQTMSKREADRRQGCLMQIDDAYPGGKRSGGKAGPD